MDVKQVSIDMDREDIACAAEETLGHSFAEYLEDILAAVMSGTPLDLALADAEDRLTVLCCFRSGGAVEIDAAPLPHPLKQPR